MNIRDFFSVKTKTKTKETTDMKESKKKEINKNIDESKYIGHEEVEEIDIDESKPKFMIGKYNLYNMFLEKKKKNYNIMIKHFGKSEKIKFKLSYLKSPFGVEMYSHKEIVNLEFTNHETNNLSFNNYTIFKQLDDMFSKLNTKTEESNNFININSYQLNSLNGLHYSPLLKERPNNYDPLARFHLRKVKNTIATKCYKKVDGKLEQISVFEIKGKMMEVELELSSLWISDDSYGIVIVINQITIIG